MFFHLRLLFIQNELHEGLLLLSELSLVNVNLGADL